MDFIEQWLHIAPDGGSGATEFFIVAALVVVVFALVFHRQLLAVLTHRQPEAEEAVAEEKFER